jgi:hypothetical protein
MGARYTDLRFEPLNKEERNLMNWTGFSKWMTGRADTAERVSGSVSKWTDGKVTCSRIPATKNVPHGGLVLHLKYEGYTGADIECMFPFPREEIDRILDRAVGWTEEDGNRLSYNLNTNREYRQVMGAYPLQHEQEYK